MNPNTRSVLSSWFSSEERPATATPGHHQEAPDYVYAPMHPTLAKKMEKRGAGRGRGAPYGSKPAPRSAGPSPIRPSASSTSGRPPRALDDGVVAVARGPRRQLRSSHDGGPQDDHQRGHQNPDAIKAGRNYNTEAFDYNGSSGSGAEAPFWRAARSLPSSASSTPKKPFQPPRQRRSRFKEHLSPEEVEQGLKDGSLLQGVLRVNHKRMRLAYVSVEGFDKDILIDGVFARNRAFEGDVVVIRLNDPSEWEVVKDDKDDEEDEAEPLVDDDDEVDEDLIKPLALDDSVVDVMTDTDDDEVPESDTVSIKADAESCTATTATEKATTAENVPVLDGKVPDYEEALDSEQTTSSSRGWWQPSAATAEVAVEVESGATTTAAAESTVPVVMVSSSQPTTPRAKGKRCWKCQEVGHISRDCTNPKSAETPVKKEKPHGTKEKKPAKQPAEIKEGEETKLRRTAKVVAIVKPNHVEEMVGYLKPCGLAEEELGRGNFYAFFVPLEKRMPRILVPVKRLSASIINHPNELTTNLFVCKLTGWPASSGHPRGELIKNMGPSGDMEVELRVLLQDNNIDWEDSFAPEVVACLPRIPPAPARWEIPAEEFITRKDLRKERIFTIDPATAKDMDDAVSCKRLPDGTYLVGVHIADVTYFVKPNTPLDEDAKMRATTVYMVHRSIPMLPRLLSDNMCSLVPGEDRLSFSVTWKMDKEGNVLEEPWFGRTIIRSCVKMSYEAAQEMLDDRFTPPSAEPPAPDAAAKPVVKRGSVFAKDLTAPEHTVEEIIDDVKVLNAMAESLRKKRFEDGSLTLDDAKMYFCLDDDKMPIDVGVYVRTASHFLIEEFMLLANKSVAKRIHSAFPDRALLRRHPAPNDNKLAEFISMCSANSISFDTSSSKGFQRSLLALNSLPNPDIAAVVTRLAMKPMSVAKYTCTDEEAGEGAYKHYALAFDHYTHFTSPIRRYADVIVHRLLDACLQGLPAPLEKEELSDICDNCNMRKTKADKAQDKCDLVFLCTLLKNHPPKDLEATVITVNSRSFEVYVPLYGVEKLARAEDLPLAKLDHDKKNQALYLHWRAAANGASSTAAEEEEEATAGKKVIVQEIKPFTRLRVRLYPDLQRRPIDVRLAIVPPEGAAVPDNYYDAPVQESAKPKTPAKQHGRRQQNHQKPPRPDHLESAAENHDNHVENWINEARDDEAMQRQQITDRIKLFLADPTQTKLHLPAELTSFERLIAHEVAEDHGLHHQSSNYFCSETGTKERRLTLFKQAPPAAARARSRSVPGSAPGAEPSAAGVKTPTRTGAKRAAKPKLPTRAAPAEGGSVDGEPHADGTRTTPKKRPARKTKEAAKERAAAVEAEVGEDGAPVEVRTKVHRPKRAPKKRPVPATTVAPVEQQGQQEPQQQHPPQEAA